MFNVPRKYYQGQVPRCQDLRVTSTTTNQVFIPIPIQLNDFSRRQTLPVLQDIAYSLQRTVKKIRSTQGQLLILGRVNTQTNTTPSILCVTAIPSSQNFSLQLSGSNKQTHQRNIQVQLLMQSDQHQQLELLARFSVPRLQDFQVSSTTYTQFSFLGITSESRFPDNDCSSLWYYYTTLSLLGPFK